MCRVVSLEHSLINIFWPCLSSKRLTSFSAKKCIAAIDAISNCADHTNTKKSKILHKNLMHIQSKPTHKKRPIATSAQKIIHFSCIRN